MHTARTVFLVAPCKKIFKFESASEADRFLGVKKGLSSAFCSHRNGNLGPTSGRFKGWLFFYDSLPENIEPPTEDNGYNIAFISYNTETDQWQSWLNVDCFITTYPQFERKRVKAVLVSDQIKFHQFFLLPGYSLPIPNDSEYVDNEEVLVLPMWTNLKWRDK